MLASFSDSWGVLGASWVRLGGVLGILDVKTPSKTIEKSTIYILVPTWVLGNLMAVLGASWGILGASWGVFGVFWAVLGGSWGASWGCSFTVPIETYYWGALLGYFLNLV